MRHRNKVNPLGRKAAHRQALLRNLAIALITHKRIKTTLAKAKALRRYIEPLLTKAKTNTTHSRRVVFSYLQNKEAITELFGPIAEKVGSRPGGYVRVIKTGFRRSDASEMAMIELVDFNEIYTAKMEMESPDTSSRRRRRRRKGDSAAAAPATTAAAPPKNLEDEPEEDEIEDFPVDEEDETIADVSEEAAEESAEETPETDEESSEEEEKEEK